MAVVQLSFNEICRGCLSKNNLQPLGFAKRIETLAECIDLKISLEDGLPSKICSDCWEQCSKWANFKEQCRKTDSTLRCLLGQDPPQKQTDSISSGEVIIVPTTVPQEEESCDTEENFPEFESIKDEDGDEPPEEFPNDPAVDMIVTVESDNDSAKKKVPRKSVTLICPVCGKKFRKESMLEAHTRAHSGKKPFVCNQCGMEFNNRLTLRNHSFKHSNQTHPCPDCDRTFSYPQLLTEHHKRQHTEMTKDFVCDTCGKSFGRKQSLNFHMLTHTDDRPLFCKVCNKSFKSQVYLNIHLVRHGDSRNYKCPEERCSKTFFTKSELNFHRRNVHSNENEKPHVCSICPKRYLKKSQLETHLRSHSGASRTKSSSDKTNASSKPHTRRRRSVVDGSGGS